MYEEVLDDPKAQRLEPSLFKAWVNLLCLASRNDGRLPSVSDIAFALRMSEDEALKILTALVDVELIDKNKGCFAPHNWNGRQYKSDVSTDRVKRFRKRRSTVTETPSEQSRADSEQSRAEAAPFPENKSAPEAEPEVHPPAGPPDPARGVIELFDRCQAEIYGAERRQVPAGDDIVFARRWLTAGADLELLGGIFRERLTAKRNAGEAAIGRLKFFDGAVNDAIRRSLTEIPEQFHRKTVPRPQAKDTKAELDEVARAAGFKPESPTPTSDQAA